mgnify:FL=1
MRIKELRETKGWSQTKLAKESGLSQSFIHAIETGKKSPTMRSLWKLSKALGVPISEIIEFKEDPK